MQSGIHMRISGELSIVAGCLGLLLLPDASPARACSGFACTGVQIAPGAGVVPANLPGFWITAGAYADAGAAVITLTRSDGSEVVQTDEQYRLTSALTPGSAYDVRVSFRSTSTCAAKELSTRIVAGSEAPLPSSLGDVTVVARGLGPTAVGFTSGSCYTNVSSSYVDLEPSLDSAAPWKPSLVNVRAIVDGKDYWISAERQPEEQIYPTRGQGVRPLTGGDTRVRVFVACEAIPPGSATGYVPLSEGLHRVRLAGHLPGVGQLQTTEAEVELRCKTDEPVPESDGEPAAQSDGGPASSDGEQGCTIGATKTDSAGGFATIIALTWSVIRGRRRARR